MVSCYLQKNAEFFENFIDGYVTIKDFCCHVNLIKCFIIIVIINEIFLFLNKGSRAHVS
jgi:hypothetical protein